MKVITKLAKCFQYCCRECGTLSRDAALGVPAYIALVAQITTQLIVVFFQVNEVVLTLLSNALDYRG